MACSKQSANDSKAVLFIVGWHWLYISSCFFCTRFRSRIYIEMFYLNNIEQLFLFVEQLDHLEVCLPYSRLLTGIPILVVFQNLRWNSNKTSLKKLKAYLSSLSNENPAEKKSVSGGMSF